MLTRLFAVRGAETAGLQALLAQPAHHHRFVAVGDDHALGASRNDGALQARPVGVVAEHKAAVDTVAAAGAAQLHPAAGEGVAGLRTLDRQLARPGAAQHPRRRDHQRLFEQTAISHVVDARCRRQRHAGSAVGGVQGLDCTVHHDRADVRINAGQQPLRLAEAVAQQQARPAGRRVGGPPGIDLGHHLDLRPPAVDRQAEGAFGDEAVAAHRLERGAGGVGVVSMATDEIVARGHPHAPAVFDAHLRRTEHVAGGVQAEPDLPLIAVDQHCLAVVQALQGDVAQPRSQHPGADCRGQVGAMAAPRVVGVGVGQHGARHRAPGVDVEVARRAVQAFGAFDDQIIFNVRQRFAPRVK